MKIVVGTGSCGLAAGAGKVLDALSEAVALGKLDASVEQTGCIGMCHLEPIVDIYSGEEYTRYTKIDQDDIKQFLNDLKSIENKKISEEDISILEAQERIVMRNYGKKIDPESIDDYIATGGYEAIKKSIERKNTNWRYWNYKTFWPTWSWWCRFPDMVQMESCLRQCIRY